MLKKIVQVDAFADRPFTGNPAAVCIMAGPADETWMQQVAMEMNLSETAFLYPYQHGYHLRWFRPRSEADLCGHATLAGAHVLFEDGHVRGEETIHFFTRSGWVSVDKDDDWIVLHFPGQTATEVEPPAGLLEALGVGAVFVGQYIGGYLVQVESEETVRDLQPDFNRLLSLDRQRICVTAAGTTDESDFGSRLFAPALGINEDPVNGNSHTALTPFWAERLGKTKMISRQLSHRGGLLRVELDGDTVHIGGQAVITIRGELVD